MQPQEQFEVEIVVDTKGHDVYGVQYELYYKNSVVRAETQVPGNLSDHGETAIVVNNIDHASGKIEYGETLLGDSCAEGTIVLARIQFTAIGAHGTIGDLDDGVVFVDCNKKENNRDQGWQGNIQEQSACRNRNIKAQDKQRSQETSKHRINNAAKKYQCFAKLCACKSYDPDQIKGYISYIRWAFGDGQYGTSEGIDECQKEHHGYGRVIRQDTTSLSLRCSQSPMIDVLR